MNWDERLARDTRDFLVSRANSENFWIIGTWIKFAQGEKRLVSCKIKYADNYPILCTKYNHEARMDRQNCLAFTYKREGKSTYK